MILHLFPCHFHYSTIYSWDVNLVVSAFRSLRLGAEGRCRPRVAKTGCKQQMSVKPLRRGRALGFWMVSCRVDVGNGVIFSGNWREQSVGKSQHASIDMLITISYYSLGPALLISISQNQLVFGQSLSSRSAGYFQKISVLLDFNFGFVECFKVASEKSSAAAKPRSYCKTYLVGGFNLSETY